MEETSPLGEKVETEKREEEKVGVVGEVDMVLILHEKVAIKMGFGKHFCFLETETLYHHTHTPSLQPPFFFFHLFGFCIYCFSKQEMMLFGACMHQLNPSHHPSYIIITSKTSASNKEIKKKKEKKEN